MVSLRQYLRITCTHADVYEYYRADVWIIVQTCRRRNTRNQYKCKYNRLTRRRVQGGNLKKKLLYKNFEISTKS